MQKLEADLSYKLSVAIWGRDTTITSFTLLVWSASIAGSFWSTFDPLFIYFWIRSQDARLCRYYEGKHSLLPTMAKDVEVRICGRIIYSVSGRMEPRGKGVCHLGNEFFPLESTR